jgi:hypothetical protein
MTVGSSRGTVSVGAMMMRILAFRAAVATLGLLALASPGFAQSQGIVTADRAVIWRTDSSVVATVVDAGVVLELTGRSDRWYEVIIPTNLGGRGERGLISITQVRLVDGSELPVERVLRGSDPPAPTPPQSNPVPRPAPPSGPAVALRGFGQAGIIGFAASETFAAITGQSYGPAFGAGAQVRFRAGLYLQVSIERFRQTGERAFVFEDEVFPLGIPNTITIQPVIAAVGYRPSSAASIRPYLGAGVGTYHLQEVSPFDDPSEEVDQWHRGFHAHGGVEFLAGRWFAPAVEARFTTVPDALGSSGAAAEFGESNLGGWEVFAKILLGP